MLTDHPWLIVWLTTLLTQSPTLLALLASCACLFAGWRRLGQAAPWGLAGFGLLLLRTLATSGLQILSQYWAQEAHIGFKTIGFRLMLIGVTLSSLDALALALITVAIFAGRPRPGVPPPLPTPLYNPAQAPYEPRL